MTFDEIDSEDEAKSVQRKDLQKEGLLKQQIKQQQPQPIKSNDIWGGGFDEVEEIYEIPEVQTKNGDANEDEDDFFNFTKSKKPQTKAQPD